MGHTGDMIIPEGTKVSWEFNTINTEQIAMRFIESEQKNLAEAQKSDEGVFSYSVKCFRNSSYTIKTNNEFVIGRDSITYWINVVPDMFPEIEVDEQKDSLAGNRLFFTGLIKDDYGFEKLAFNFIKSTNENGAIGSKNFLCATNLAVLSVIIDGATSHTRPIKKIGIRAYFTYRLFSLKSMAPVKAIGFKDAIFWSTLAIISAGSTASPFCDMLCSCMALRSLSFTSEK